MAFGDVNVGGVIYLIQYPYFNNSLNTAAYTPLSLLSTYSNYLYAIFVLSTLN